ncbi:hypothetical protein [Sphingorhabdus sp. M41]|uniref:hypothetical protein n=1 Tax=Sphingorhabdus sp. M41 TaxID=1806885 RepID=UPI00078E3701|nr:hypothetical protein [Sphingorhabdus sp. M41]AMO71129.1 hypothetical protein AZE99_04015 [Sphingorhabdus sp. M41]
MSKKITVGLIAMLALSACGDAKDEGETDRIATQPDSTAEGNHETADAIKSPETAPVETKQSKVSDKADQSNSSVKSDSGLKTADCKITSIPGDTHYKGDCDFLPHGGGSFTVKRSNGQSFVDGVTAFVLELDTKTAAGLSVRDANGDLTYLGTAEKSTIDGACWESENHSVCAYAK